MSRGPARRRVGRLGGDGGGIHKPKIALGLHVWVRKGGQYVSKCGCSFPNEPAPEFSRGKDEAGDAGPRSLTQTSGNPEEQTGLTKERRRGKNKKKTSKKKKKKGKKRKKKKRRKKKKKEERGEEKRKKKKKKKEKKKKKKKKKKGGGGERKKEKEGKEGGWGGKRGGGGGGVGKIPRDSQLGVN